MWLSAISHSDFPGPIRVLWQKNFSEPVGFIDTLGPICQLTLWPHLISSVPRFLWARGLYQCFVSELPLIDIGPPKSFGGIPPHCHWAHSSSSAPFVFWPGGLYRCFQSDLLLIYVGPSVAFGSPVKQCQWRHSRSSAVSSLWTHGIYRWFRHNAHSCKWAHS